MGGEGVRADEREGLRKEWAIRLRLVSQAAASCPESERHPSHKALPLLTQTLLEEHAPAAPIGPHGIVVCPRCHQPLVAGAASYGVNRGTVTRTALRIRVSGHARAVHTDLSVRERSLLADAAVEGMQ